MEAYYNVRKGIENGIDHLKGLDARKETDKGVDARKGLDAGKEI